MLSMLKHIALLQYRSSDKKFVTRTNLDTDHITLTFNDDQFLGDLTNEQQLFRLRGDRSGN